MPQAIHSHISKAHYMQMIMLPPVALQPVSWPRPPVFFLLSLTCLAGAIHCFIMSNFITNFLPHFIFTSIPWLSNRPPSSETSFRNLFCNSVFEHPCSMYSTLLSFKGHACYQTDYSFPQICLVRFTVTCFTFEPQFHQLVSALSPHPQLYRGCHQHTLYRCNDNSRTLSYQGGLFNFTALFMRNVLFEQ